MIQVMICDDQEIVCDGLDAILSTDTEIEVVGIAHDGAQAIELAMQSQPDLILMDLKMPVMNGVQATQAIKTHLPSLFVLVLTTYANDEWLFDALRAGASGYLLKDTPRKNIIQAIKETVAGKSLIDPAVAGRLIRYIQDDAFKKPTSTLFDKLNEREREILGLIAQGRSNAEIATALHLSRGTIKNYVSTILDKLSVSDRTQAAVLAHRYDLNL
ncbi:MAG: response regulator transcription factor [Chloroflexota bacterium]